VTAGGREEHRLPSVVYTDNAHLARVNAKTAQSVSIATLCARGTARRRGDCVSKYQPTLS